MSDTPRERARGPVALMLLAWAATTHRTWLLGQTYYLRDFWTNYVPTRHILREAFSRWALPLWDPWLRGGIPVLPDPNHGVFYLPAWPFLVPDAQAWALSAAADAHLLLAMVGTYLLARRVTSSWGAAIAGTLFGLGGLMQSNVVNTHWHFAYAWAPWWFGCALRLLDELFATTPRPARLRWVAALAAVWGLQLVASEPQVAYLEGLALPLLVVGRLMAGPERGRGALGSLLAFPLSVALAALLAGPQLAGLFEALPLTDRAQMTPQEAAIWSVHLGRVWELALPMPWGANTPAMTFWGGRLVNGPWNGFYFYSLYASALAVPLALVGLSRLTPRAVPVSLGAAVLTVAAFGQATPVNEWLRRTLPLWNAFRYPERFLVLPTLGLAVLCALGADAVIAAKRRVPLGLLLVLPAAAAAIAWRFPAFLGAQPTDSDAPRTIQRAALHAALAALAITAVALRANRLRGLLVAGVLATDLVALSPGVLASWIPPDSEPFVSKEPERIVFSTNDIVDASMRLPRDPILRRSFEDHVSRPNLGVTRGFRSMGGVSSLELTRARMLRETLGAEDAWLWFQARYIVADHRHHFRQYNPERDLGLGIRLFRHPGDLPPVICTSRWTAATGATDAAASIREGHIVEGLSASTPNDAPPELPCTLERPTPERLTLTLAPQSHPVLARLSESYFPGWTGRVSGGGELAVVPTDLAFLGLVVPPNTSKVELSYRPYWLTPLLFTSVGALVLTFVLLASPFRGRTVAE